MAGVHSTGSSSQGVLMRVSSAAAARSRYAAAWGWPCRNVAATSGDGSPSTARCTTSALCSPVAIRAISRAWRIVGTPHVSASRGTLTEPPTRACAGPVPLDQLTVDPARGAAGGEPQHAAAVRSHPAPDRVDDALGEEGGEIVVVGDHERTDALALARALDCGPDDRLGSGGQHEKKNTSRNDSPPKGFKPRCLTQRQRYRICRYAPPLCMPVVTGGASVRGPETVVEGRRELVRPP